MTKKAVETGFVDISDLAPNGVGGGDKVIYDGKEYAVVTVDLYEHLIGIDECGDGNISYKRTESIDKYIPFTR